MQRFLLTFLALAFFSIALAACNTMEGAGEDIQATGRSLERSAQEHKNY
ncbi:MAG: entericidin A/B family lipoprotein [Dongiaceae bacterium]